MDLTNEGMCFVCGFKNPIGLKLEFSFEGNEYTTEFTPSEMHQGFDGIIHGGLITTVMDEVMARMLWVQGIFALTTELHITLRQSARVGEKLLIRGWMESQRSRKIICHAKANREDGTLIAEAQAAFIRVTRKE